MPSRSTTTRLKRWRRSSCAAYARTPRRIAKNMTGAAPLPEEATLPATTPCPGGEAGESGARSSSTPLLGGALVGRACEAIAWCGAFDELAPGTSIGAAGAPAWMIGTAGAPATGVAKRVVTPAASCELVRLADEYDQRAEKPTWRTALEPSPKKFRPTGKASG